MGGARSVRVGSGCCPSKPYFYNGAIMRAAPLLLLVLLAVPAPGAGLTEEIVFLETGEAIPVRRAVPVSRPEIKAEGISLGFTAAPPRIEFDLLEARRTSRQSLNLQGRVTPEGGPEIGYDFDARVQRVDPVTGEYLDPAMAKSMVLGHRGYVRWNAARWMRFLASTGIESTTRDMLPEPERVVRHRFGATWLAGPRTSLTTEAATSARWQSGDVLPQDDSLSTRFEQRVGAWPLNFSVAHVFSRPSLSGVPSAPTTSQRVMPSLRWTVDDDTALTLGFESASVSRETEGAPQQSGIHAAEVRLEAADRLALRIRGSLESRTEPGAEAGDAASVEVIPGLSTGLDLEVLPGFTAGVGVHFGRQPGTAESKPAGSWPAVTIFGAADF